MRIERGTGRHLFRYLHAAGMALLGEYPVAYGGFGGNGGDRLWVGDLGYAADSSKLLIGFEM